MKKQKTQKPLNSILIKPASADCNLSCEYCFYLRNKRLSPKNPYLRMNLTVLEEMLRQILRQDIPQISFVWQGGEPTLMGLDFYRQVVRLQQKWGRTQMIGNALQTNGILLDKKWAAFLREYQFLVGLSLDGPEHIHDRYRCFPNGRGSWRTVEDRAKLLLDQEIAVNVLSTVTSYSVAFPEEMYDYFCSLGLVYMQFIPILEVIPETGEIAPFSVRAEEYGEFLGRLFDRWFADLKDGYPSSSIRFFDRLLQIHLGQAVGECVALEECGVYLVIEHNGDVYPCDFFVTPEWKLGNVMRDSLLQLLNSDRQNEFGAMKSDLPKLCRECRWLRYCYGGCSKDRQRLGSHNRLNPFCRAYQRFFAYAHDRLQAAANTISSLESQKHPGSDRPRGKVGRNDPCPCGSGKKYKNCCGSV